MNPPLSARELQSGQGGKAQMDELIEGIECPNCNDHRCRTLRPAAYPPELSRAELLKIYSASSDHILFDAIVQCEECSLVYLNPRVRRDLILESYKIGRASCREIVKNTIEEESL